MIEQLRKKLKTLGCDAFLVPVADPYQNEYVLDSYRYLTQLSGFRGSTGFGIVTLAAAAVFVDSRYTVQAKREVTADVFQVLPYTETSIHDFLKEAKVIGFDPWLHTWTAVLGFQKAGFTLVPIAPNPLDDLWKNRPSLPQEPAFDLPLIFSGETSESKCQRVASILKGRGQKTFFLGDATSINWLLNIRGHDLENTPVILTYALVHQTGKVDVFVPHGTERMDAVKAGLPHVQFLPLEDLNEHLHEPVTFSGDHTPYEIASRMTSPSFDADPCVPLKAIKNEVEQQGFRSCHTEDGAALTAFLYHLTKAQGLDEITAAQTLDQLRLENASCKGLSFKTISAVSENAALPHYSASPETNKPLGPGDMYLVDSGGQYYAGTTDVTRTVSLGSNPTAAQKHHYTLVLKGHIALAMARFPKGLAGCQLDILARQFLFQEGLDYGHGTGHGVGHFLNVHEGPQNVSGALRNKTPLAAGMVISNEPGYYLEGAYGIRIENLVLVHEKDGFLYFETLTAAPLDPSLVEFDILTSVEKAWLSSYHAHVYEILQEKLEAPVRDWLQGICRKFGAQVSVFSRRSRR